MNTKRALLQLTVSASLLMAASIAQAQLYWRGDIGYSWSTNADIQDKNFALDGGICGNAACTTAGKIDKVGNSFLLSGGVGWRFTPNFRMDGTLTYRGWYKIDETLADATNFKADVKSWNLMANGYWDFPLTWGAPYVMGGVGYASNKVDTITATNSGIPFNLPGGTTGNFAWALGGGVGVRINPSLTLDVGLRYTDLGKLETDSGVITFAGIPVGTYSGAKGNLRAWELTVGLRF